MLMDLFDLLGGKYTRRHIKAGVYMASTHWHTYARTHTYIHEYTS